MGRGHHLENLFVFSRLKRRDLILQESSVGKTKRNSVFQYFVKFLSYERVTSSIRDVVATPLHKQGFKCVAIARKKGNLRHLWRFLKQRYRGQLHSRVTVHLYVLSQQRVNLFVCKCSLSYIVWSTLANDSLNKTSPMLRTRIQGTREDPWLKITPDSLCYPIN